MLVRIFTSNIIPLKTFLIFLTTISISLTAEAQKKIVIDVSNNTDKSSMSFSPTSAISMGKNGFVLSYQNDDKKSDITYYNTAGESQWHITAPKEYSASRSGFGGPSLTAYVDSENVMVASNSGSWVYNVDMVSEKFYKKESYITQIGKTGTPKRFTIAGHDGLGRSLQTMFSDEAYFYILATESANEDNYKKRATEKLILNRFNATDFGYKKFVLELPPLDNEGVASYWTFIGQSETEKFLVSKSIREGKIVSTIAAFDDNGNVTRVFEIELALDKKFIRPCLGVRSLVANFYQRSNFDFGLKQNADRHTMIFPTYASFSHIQFDAETKSFYIIGLFGPKEFKTVASVYDGFYISKYNIDGKNQWKLQQPAGATLMADSRFRIHAAPGYRELFLKVNPDQSLFFSIHVEKKLYTCQVSNEGKPGQLSKKEKMYDLTEPYEFIVKE